jgi:hypothetical protein
MSVQWVCPLTLIGVGVRGGAHQAPVVPVFTDQGVSFDASVTISEKAHHVRGLADLSKA